MSLTNLSRVSLYHFTEFDFLESILKSNTLVANIPKDVQLNKNEYPDWEHTTKRVSFTEDKHFESFGDVRFNMNQKIWSLNPESYVDPTLSGDYEKEWIVKRDVKPLSDYVDSVWVFNFDKSDYRQRLVNMMMRKNEFQKFNVIYKEGWDY